MIARTERLGPEVLARFDRGLTWPDILGLTLGRGKDWWRDVIGTAEDDGLLRWFAGTKGERGRWVLTDEGRDYIRARSLGAA